MSSLPSVFVPIPKPTRNWVLFEHVVFIPLVLLGVFRPLVGLAFVFSLMGLFFSRNTEFLPGSPRARHRVKLGLWLCYSLVLLCSIAMLLWPLSGSWRPVPNTSGWSDAQLAILPSSEGESLVALSSQNGKISLQSTKTQGESWKDLSYPGGHSWHIESFGDALWVIPAEQPKFYVYRNHTWESFARPGGYCDSFAVTKDHLWFAIGSLYEGDPTTGQLTKIESVPSARYVAASGEVVLVGSYQRWYESDDAGKQWRELTPPEDGNTEPFVSPDGWRYWLDSGFFSSSLYVEAPGQSMKKVSLPVGDPRVLILNPTNGAEAWLGSWEGGVYRTLDGAQTWIDMGLQRVQVRSMAVDFKAKVAYAASSNVFFDKSLFALSFAKD